MDEQRRHPRVDASRIVVRIQNAERFRTLYLRDLSRGGLFVKSDKRLALGTEATVELWPPEWKEPLVLDAKVVRWQEAVADAPSGMGMQFQPLQSEALQRLERLVDEYREGAADDLALSQVTDLIRELETARRTVQDLTGEVARLREQSRETEQDDADLRAVVEKLATEKAASERRWEESLAGLTKRLEDIDADRLRASRELEKQKGEEAALRDVMAQAEKESRKMAQEIGDLRTKLEEQAATARLQKERADYLADEVEKRRAKERDLRKLLAAIGASSAPESSRPVPKAAAATDDAIEVEVAEPSAAPERTTARDESFDEFQERLTASTRLVATDRLAGRESRSDAEALVAGLLQAGPTFGTLLNQIEGKMAEATLHRLLYDLHAAAQLELRG